MTDNGVTDNGVTDNGVIDNGVTGNGVTDNGVTGAPKKKKKKKKKAAEGRAAQEKAVRDVARPDAAVRDRAGPDRIDAEARTQDTGQPVEAEGPRRRGAGGLRTPLRRVGRLVPASRTVTGVLLVLVIGCGIGLGLAGQRINQLNSANALRSSALTDARKYVVDLTTYDYKDLGAQQARIASEATAAFNRKFVGSIQQLSGVFDQVHADAAGSVLDAGVQSISDDAAVVTVFVDQQASSSQQKATTQASRILVTLSRAHGRWLLDSIQLV